MQARPTEALPHGPEWRYEIKWDGFRVLALKDGPSVRLLSRNNVDLTARFPSVAESLAHVSARSAILDGELVALDERGVPSFQALMRGGRSGKQRLHFFAFDLLHRDGRDLRGIELDDRAERLAAVIAGSPVSAPGEVRAEPDVLPREARKLRLEGIVAKRRDSAYVPGDSAAWLKFKLRQSQEFVIGGYVPPLQALVVGCYHGKRLMFVSQVYAGLDKWSRREMSALLAPHATTTCPFANVPMKRPGQFGDGITAEDMVNYRWVRPAVAAQIEFQEWTPAGLLRHSRFAGVREDKAPRDCRREVTAGESHTRSS